MATTQTWSEYNGSTYTETGSRTDCNWKNIDDSTTAYGSSPITVPTSGTAYSYPKHQAIKFGGTYASISALTYKVSSAAPGTGVALNASVLTSQPTQGTAGAPNSNANTTDSAASTTGTSANLVSSTSAYGAGTASYTTAGGVYGQVYRTQLAVGTTAGPGDITPVTITATWTES